MDNFSQEKARKKKVTEVKTLPVPFALGEIKTNITINTNTPSKLSKEQIINQAIQFHQKGNILEATKYYQFCIKKGFNDHLVFANYAGILKDLGKLKEAELSLLKAIEIKPDYAVAHSNLGTILKDLGKLEEAELSTRKAIKIKPDYADAHVNLGVILIDLDKLEEAELSTRKAIEIKPDYAEAHLNLGNILKDLGKLKEAELSTRKAIKIKPDSAEGYYNLGNILKGLGKLKDAEFSCRKAIELNPDFTEALSNLGSILLDLGNLKEAEIFTRKAIEIKPDFVFAAWNLYGLANSIEEAEERINQCLKIDENYVDAKVTLSALKLHQGDQSLFANIIKSTHKDHPITRAIKWVSTLPKLPELFFNKEALFDYVINKSKKDRPFYEFGVWRGESFKYLINTFKKGYGFDTFEGLPEDWHNEKQGTYSAEGSIPKIDGATFIAGKFEETLPTFYSKPRPMASLINFDADLYSSTLCALNYSKSVIDKDSILIFDEFIINKNWEQDEYKALNEFCSNNNLTYEVLAVSYFTKQVAMKLIGV
ncbi:hypothetical protein DNJ72_08330 [Prochlorococcus marinus XMU1403]|uniref:protein arginine N-methyltransferase n=1 Tax=Prochlorococcus marinus TaxID=1219 RepID=UPI000D8A19D0|nr:tetratricopeptide repeat protein [Prochlorococcus marinus]MBW3050148.1 hypothetical protein [Prochlorococcus marinus str. MU1403]PYE00342.1 hypothetical protein DNJ72_08330 [Prochlorococcus marinus XMU1403]